MTVHWTDLGLADYLPVWALQRRLVADLKAGAGPERLLLVEHRPVLTLGRRADPGHVLLDAAGLAARGLAVLEVERGGDVTYHGPGQLVAYPILDLRRHRPDLRWFTGALLDAVVRVAAEHGVAAAPRWGAETGVWVTLPDGGAAKLASMGVRVERWVTYHGVALNVATDLSAFEAIVPCGLAGVRMVSLAALTGAAPDMAAVKAGFLAAFGQAFGLTLTEDRAPAEALAAGPAVDPEARPAPGPAAGPAAMPAADPAPMPAVPRAVERPGGARPMPAGGPR